MDDHRLLEEASEELADEPSTAAGLRATAEQLQVVEEELHQQNEELAAAREALEAERNRYQELFECAPDGYLITDPEGMIGEANRAAAVLLGMEPGLLVGKPLANFLPKEECRAFRTKLSQLRQASRLQVWGVSLQPCRGAPFDAALTVATVRDAEQRLQGLRWLIRDISDQKRAEDQIRSLNATLEERVRERTAQLEEAHRAREELLVQEQAARAEAEAAQRRLAFLSEASSMLASSLDYETTLDQVARLVVPHLGDWCIVDMVEGDGSFRVLAMTHVDPAKEGLVRELRRRYPPDLNEPHGLGTVLRTGQPEVVAAVSDALLEAIACDAEHARLLRELGCQSLIRVPLQARGQPFGVLSLGSEQPGGRCGPDDLALAEELARRAALAVDNARLYHEAQTEITERKRAEEALRVRASQRAAIVELGQCALEGTDLSALMDQAAVLVAQTLGVEYAQVVKLLPGGKTLLLRAGVGWREGLVGHATVGAGAESQAGYTLFSREPVVVEDLRIETRFSGSCLLHDHRVVSGMSVIISRQDAPFGVLGVHSARPRSFSQDDVHFLQAIANLLAVAIERTRAEAARRESEERFRLLVEGVKDYAISLLDPSGCVVSWNAGAERIQGYRAEEIIGRHFSCFYSREDRECGKPIKALNQAAAADWFEDEGWRERQDGSRFWANVVMTALRDEAGHLRGFSNMTRDVTEHKRAQEAQRQLTTLLEREREIVQALTESVLGRTPQLPGFQVASFYQPAAKTDRVGGDYFDFIQIDPHRLGVVIGDVCGKGLPAALYTAMAKYTLHAYAREAADPETVLYRVNEALYSEIGNDEMFVTLVYGVLDLETGAFTYANAGHPAPVLYDPAARRCQLLEATGGMVGGFPHWEYQQRSVSLAPGAVLALFTDGVTEAARWKNPLDGSEMSALLQEHAGAPADAIAGAIFHRARDLAGGDLRDDVAIVVIRRP